MLAGMPAVNDAISTSERLLDAHVAWLLQRLTGDGIDGDDAHVGPEIASLALDVLGPLTLHQIVDVEVVVERIDRILTTVPPSARAAKVPLSAASALVEDTEALAPRDLIETRHVEALLRLLSARADLVGSLLERAARSPRFARLSSAVLTRIVAEVVAANRAMAARIPGIGPLVSMGAKAGSRVIGAADRPLDALFGDTADKGAQVATRLLAKVLVDTLRDPATVEAFLEAHTVNADEPLPPLSAVTTTAELRDLVAVLHDIAATAAPRDPVRTVVASVVRRVFAEHGHLSATELLDDLGLGREELLAHCAGIAPRALAVAHERGRLEPAVRAYVAPFYRSEQVAAILSDDRS